MRQRHVVQTDFRKDQQRPARAKESFTIDYPQEGETVNGRHYSLRVSAPQDAETVELCINQGSWLPCRQASGYWWFDFINIEPEPCQTRARLRTRGGKEKLTMLRRFQAQS
jgi:hypothetical protein